MINREKLLLLSKSKSIIGFRLVYLHLILTHFKGQDQDHAYMTVSVLEILRDSVKITACCQTASQE